MLFYHIFCHILNVCASPLILFGVTHQAFMRYSLGGRPNPGWGWRVATAKTGQLLQRDKPFSALGLRLVMLIPCTSRILPLRVDFLLTVHTIHTHCKLVFRVGLVSGQWILRSRLIVRNCSFVKTSASYPNYRTTTM